MFDIAMKMILGSQNDRDLKRLKPKVVQINELESKVKPLTDDQIRARIAEFKDQVQHKGRSLDDVLAECFALTRESGMRALGMRHFDVQLIGGMVLHQGRIAEMRTGEGKTLVATLPSVLNALEGRGVHVVTVNDYLAKRDAEWMGRLYNFMGLSWGVIVHDLTDKQRQHAYRSDITYGQNNEFGFDYLRDNMKFRLQDYVQRELNYAVVDEVDSILIDEARTPLIISGPSDESSDKYYKVDKVLPQLQPERDYEVDEKMRSVLLTDEGVTRVEKALGIRNLYDPGEIETLHHVEQALRAHALYKRDRDYVVRSGEVLIVDEHTGRVLPGRRWSDGLHQAIEAKEGVKIEAENQTLATVSFQNFFRMYTKLAGMTGTADTEAAEFDKTYHLKVNVIPTNRSPVRKDAEDVVYRSEREKFVAVAEEIGQLHSKGQPVLVGTVSIAKSEALASILKRKNIAHEVLNAKQHEREALIIAQAGRKGAVTIATNMAGRGTDILLGGNPETMARAKLGPRPVEPSEGPDGGTVTLEQLEAYKKEVAAYEVETQRIVDQVKAECQAEGAEVRAAGGLFILGTERHESRRIDNQLRGRAGRQGDPGASKFFLSLEDDLMRIFGSERIGALMERMGMEEGEVIEHKWLTASIANAQEKVEAHHFDSRKQMLEYDDVMNQQRRTIYGLRKKVLGAGADVPVVEFDEDVKTRKKTRREFRVTLKDQRERVIDYIEDLIINTTERCCPKPNVPAEWDFAGLEKALKEQFEVVMKFTTNVPTSREDLQSQIFKVVIKQYESKEKEMGADNFRRLEQYIFLSTIDALWKDHLLAMDHLRQGIGLRGYAQIDPKTAYKKEGFELFEMMMGNIRSSVVGTLLRLQPQPAAPQINVQVAPSSVQQSLQPSGELTAEALERKLAARATVKTIETHGGEPIPNEVNGAPPSQAAAQAAGTTTAPKIGRNDPCYCGSGKKYKKCHGANEVSV
jgi:preprotein translocase subunit SecA